MNVQGKLLHMGVCGVAVIKMFKILCDGKGLIRQAILYTDRSFIFILFQIILHL